MWGGFRRNRYGISDIRELSGKSDSSRTDAGTHSNQSGTSEKPYPFPPVKAIGTILAPAKKSALELIKDGVVDQTQELVRHLERSHGMVNASGIKFTMAQLMQEHGQRHFIDGLIAVHNHYGW